MRENIIQEKHNGSLSGNFGLNKTLDLFERFYYWPKMQRGVRRYIEQCVICQKGKGTSEIKYCTRCFLLLIDYGSASTWTS